MIVNRQRSVRVSIQTLNRFLSQLCEILKQADGAFTVCLVSEGEIARFNRVYRGKAGPTDVLSFRYQRSPKTHATIRRGYRKPAASSAKRVASAEDSAEAYLGDIAIAPAVARRNAGRFGRSFQGEMRILILHGVLHLMGYDHETDTGQMERRERALRRALGLA
jgi:probable rRNA maturation factor